MGLSYLGYIYFISEEVDFIAPEYEEVESSSSEYEAKVELISNDSVGGGEVNNFIKSHREEFTQKAIEEVTQLRNDGFDFKYSLDMIIEDYLSEDYLSYVVMISEYTGGANINQTVETFTFDRHGNKISLEELADLEILEEVLTHKLKEMEDDLFPEAYEQLSIRDIDSFYIDKEKLVIVFSKYEIAPGTAGIIEVTIEFNEL